MPQWLPPLFHGTLREHYVILFGSAAALGLFVSFVSAWLGAHFGARRAVRRALRNAGVPLAPAVEERLERLGTAVDAIALEVERIAEGQRFTTKLLSEARGEPIPVSRAEASRGR
jgi:hypothetical protein